MTGNPGPDIEGPAPEAALAREAPAALWEDFVDIWMFPARVFRRRRAAGWFVPTAVLVAASLAIGLVFLSAMAPYWDATMREAMAGAQEGAPSGGQMEFLGTFMKVFQIVAIPFSLFLVVAVRSAGVRIVAQPLGIQLSLREAFVVGSYSIFPVLLSQIASGTIAFLSNPQVDADITDLSLGPARLLGVGMDTPVSLALLGRLDPFILWQTALVAIGVFAIARTTKGKAIALAAIIWAVPALFGAGMASLTG